MDQQAFLALFSQIYDSAHLSSGECSDVITKSLCEHTPIIACSFYTYFEESKKLSLRSQCGFEYADYIDFELSCNSFPGQAISLAKIIKSDNLIDNPLFLNQDLITKYRLSSIITIPIKTNEKSKGYYKEFAQDYLGALCIYPYDLQDTYFNSGFTSYISELVGKAYAYSLLTDQRDFRAKIISNPIKSKDLNSFLYKTLKLLQKGGQIEGGSAFINDPRDSNLYMRATTGVTSDLPIIQRLYRKDDIDSSTLECFNSNKILIRNDLKPNRKYPEITKNKEKTILYIPIREPDDRNKNSTETTGVLRVVNCIVQKGEIHKCCNFGWEDIALLLYIAEIVGVIAHLFRRNDDLFINFERSIHGIKAPIRSVKTRLSSVRNSVLSHKSEMNLTTIEGELNKVELNLKNCFVSLDALKWQIEKHTTRENFDTIETESMNLYGEVLAKIAAFARDTYEFYGVEKLEMNSLIDSGFENLPKVIGNVKALTVVFRNLIENALKYSKRKEACRIEITWSSDKNSIHIYISDYGMGIDKAHKKKIFDESFRSIEAMRREPASTGIGLSDSRKIIKELEGDLYLVSYSNPTTFIVKLRRAH